MKLKKVAAAFALAFGASTAALAVPIAVPGATFNADSLDWSPTSFLALGGTTAITKYLSGQGSTTFTVYTHSKLIGYIEGTEAKSLPAGSTPWEITVVASFQEQVTYAEAGFARFRAVPNTGFIQMYLDTSPDSNFLAGTGFNDGRLILTGLLNSNPSGNFTVEDTALALLDQSSNGDDWGGQQTVTGFGSNSNLPFTVTGFDGSVFTGGIATLSMFFENVSIGLPFVSVDPSKCYMPETAGGGETRGAGDVGSSFATISCGDGLAGISPTLGFANGGVIPGTTQPFGPDFIAQSDYNSPLRAERIPLPGTLGLLGLGFASIGLVARRKRT